MLYHSTRTILCIEKDKQASKLLDMLVENDPVPAMVLSPGTIVIKVALREPLFPTSLRAVQE